ncbi:transketolase family protein [Candidatus Saccharibacteria bacterium]|nr:transketolase family protein [Candidatus Saccharibacteria bacterium]
MKDEKIATREAYSKTLIKLGKKHQNIVSLEADLGGSTQSAKFGAEFPDRYFNMGIAEQDMFSAAAGMATCGKIPFVSTFAMFAAGRPYDQVRNSICYPRLNVKICASHAGITAEENGPTHQMIEDFSLMRTLPNMTVCSTADFTSTAWLVEEILKIDGPVYFRISKIPIPLIYDENQKFEIGKGIQFGDGRDATVIATGVMLAEALQAKEILEKKGIDIRVIDIHTIKPIDRKIIIKAAKETKKLITIEDHNIIGGLGSAVCEVVSEEYPTKVVRMGINDQFGKSGNMRALMEYFHLTAKDIAKTVREIL